MYRINLRQKSEVNHRYPYTTVWVDRWSGQIKEVRNPSQFSQGEVFASWIWPLHTGEAVGAGGRLLWFFSGISLFVLYVSGMLRYLCKRGIVRDRPVNYKNIKHLGYQIKASGLKAGTTFYVNAVRLLKKLLPHIRQLYVKSLNFINQQVKK